MQPVNERIHTLAALLLRKKKRGQDARPQKIIKRQTINCFS
jgi:hypothetical protein